MRLKLKMRSEALVDFLSNCNWLLITSLITIIDKPACSVSLSVNGHRQVNDIATQNHIVVMSRGLIYGV